MSDERWRTAGLIVGFWVLESVYSAAQVVYRSAPGPRPWSWGSALHSEMTYAYLGALLTPLILWLARRFPIERNAHWIRNLAVHVAAGSVFAMVMKLHWDVMAADPKPYYLAVAFSWSWFFRSIVIAFDLGFVLYWGIVLTVLAADYYHRYQQSRVEAAQLQTELVQAQLRALRAQLDPHFLFNTLHSISELVHEDPEGAEQMIARLSELLRRSLDASGAPEVPLRDEVSFLNLYLDIERARFDDRLQVEIRVTPEAEQCLVPTLILQPLVENAIIHGISKRLAGGRIQIAAERRGDQLHLLVKDNGSGIAHPYAIREGVGLSTVRGRLERLYGAGQHFELHSTGDGVEARAVVPYRAAERSTFLPQERLRTAYAAH